MSGRPVLGIRRLEAVDADALFGLHELVVRSLPDAQLYRRSPREYFERHLAAEGLTLGVFRDAELVGYALLRFPALREDNLGRDVGLCDSALVRVAHLEECAIHPTFRGRGLQSELTARRLCIAAALGYRHALVTISPLNRPSLENHLRHGLRVAKLTEKYGGFARFILHRGLTFDPRRDGVWSPAARDEAGPGDSGRPSVRVTVVPVGALGAIRTYLDAGYRGCALQKRGDADVLILACRSASHGTP